MLYFFYDQEQKTWGFDPKDRGSWKVLFFETNSQQLYNKGSLVPTPIIVFKEKPVRFSKVVSYPSQQDDRIRKLNFNTPQSDEYDKLLDSTYAGLPRHQLFGYPDPVQDNDMDLECQLVSNGIYCGNPSGYRDPRRTTLEKGRTDWILLFQLDSDDDAEMMWGDAGKLYFWIKNQDLVEKRFDDVWMILQCG